MKLAVAVQRYGADINGGAELHARYIAERLARHGDVEVVTTCARDYVTWKNERPSGVEQVNGVPLSSDYPLAAECTGPRAGDPSLWGNSIAVFSISERGRCPMNGLSPFRGFSHLARELSVPSVRRPRYAWL